MALSQTDLDTLDQAIARGALSVECDGRKQPDLIASVARRRMVEGRAGRPAGSAARGWRDAPPGARPLAAQRHVRADSLRRLHLATLERFPRAIVGRQRPLAASSSGLDAVV